MKKFTYKNYLITVLGKEPEEDYTKINCTSVNEWFQLRVDNLPEDEEALLFFIKHLIDERIKHNEKISTRI